MDWDSPPPLSRGLIFAAIEEACNESAGEFHVSLREVGML